MAAGARTLQEYKDQAGNPLPYRVAVIVFWWGAGVFAIMACGHQQAPPLAIPFFVIGFGAGLYFWIRVGLHRLLTEMTFLWILRPSVGWPLLAWVSVGNPMRGSRVERVLSMVALVGLALALWGTLPLQTC